MAGWQPRRLRRRAGAQGGKAAVLCVLSPPTNPHQNKQQAAGTAAHLEPHASSARRAGSRMAARRLPPAMRSITSISRRPCDQADSTSGEAGHGRLASGRRQAGRRPRPRCATLQETRRHPCSAPRAAPTNLRRHAQQRHYSLVDALAQERRLAPGRRRLPARLQLVHLFE